LSEKERAAIKLFVEWKVKDKKVRKLVDFEKLEAPK